MSKATLIDGITTHAAITKKQATAAYNSVVATLQAELAANLKTELPGIGKSKPRRAQPRTGATRGQVKKSPSLRAFASALALPKRLKTQWLKKQWLKAGTTMTTAAPAVAKPSIKAIKPVSIDVRRKALLAQIHIVRKQLVDSGVMDEDGYRAALRVATTSKYNVTGKDSLKLMSEYDLKDSLRHLQKLARLHQPAAQQANTNTLRTGKPSFADKVAAARPLERKLWAQWIALGKAGKLETPGEYGLYAFVKRRTDIDRPKWCTDAQLKGLIEQIKQWDKRYDSPANDGGHSE
jgi:nucleoid DNA-binding protein